MKKKNKLFATMLTSFCIGCTPVIANSIPDEVVLKMTREELKDLIKEVLEENNLEVQGGKIHPNDPPTSLNDAIILYGIREKDLFNNTVQCVPVYAVNDFKYKIEDD